MSFISVEIEWNLIYLLQYCILNNHYVSFAHIYYLACDKNNSRLYYTPCFTYERYFSLYNIMITSSAKKNIARDMLIAIALSDAYREICVNA